MVRGVFLERLFDSFYFIYCVLKYVLRGEGGYSGPTKTTSSG